MISRHVDVCRRMVCFAGFYLWLTSIYTKVEALVVKLYTNRLFIEIVILVMDILNFNVFSVQTDNKSENELL